MNNFFKYIIIPTALVFCLVLGACGQSAQIPAQSATLSAGQSDSSQSTEENEKPDKNDKADDQQPDDTSQKESDKPKSPDNEPQEPNSPVYKNDAVEPNSPEIELGEIEPSLISEFGTSEGRKKFYDSYQKVLDEFVNDEGNVEYTDLRRHRLILINAFEGLEEIKPLEIMSWSKEEKIAFWINAYNAFTLKLVIDNYPIEPRWYMVTYPGNSIIQIPGAWTKNYFEVTGLQYNLDEIKNGLLLDRFDDSRIAFALCNATKSGPFLRKDVYTAEKLNTQLDDQVNKYLNSSRGMAINDASNTLRLSTYFRMEKELFRKFGDIKKFRTYGDVEKAILNFIYPYLSEDHASWLDTRDFEIDFMKYDWELNEYQDKKN